MLKNVFLIKVILSYSYPGNTLVKDWTFGPRQVLDFGAEKYTLKGYELYEAKIESFQA